MTLMDASEQARRAVASRRVNREIRERRMELPGLTAEVVAWMLSENERVIEKLTMKRDDILARIIGRH
jgi:hypothetical protein